MAMITHARWLARSWRTGLVDVLPERNAPAAGIVAWGITLRKHFAGEWLHTHKALDGGRRFDLSRDSVLEWQHVAASAVAGLPLDGGGMLKERIVLDRKPAANRWDFELEVPAGTALALQPPLAAEEAAAGAVRPPAIVGSYAVFGPAGEKIGHFLRPFAEDADGRRAWAALDVEWLSPTLARLTVGVSWAFLDAARYPVAVDPTFGYTSIGASSSFLTASYINGFGTYSPASNGTLTAMYVYTNSAVNVTMGVYNNGTSYPTSLAAQTAGGVLSAGWAWQSQAIAGTVVGGTSYWNVLNMGGNLNVRYDTTGAIQKTKASTYVPGALANPYPSGASSGTAKLSLYSEYTAVGKTPWRLLLGRRA